MSSASGYLTFVINVDSGLIDHDAIRARVKAAGVPVTAWGPKIFGRMTFAAMPSAEDARAVREILADPLYRFEDGSSVVDWAEVVFGDWDHQASIRSHSGLLRNRKPGSMTLARIRQRNTCACGEYVPHDLAGTTKPPRLREWTCACGARYKARNAQFKLVKVKVKEKEKG